MKNIILSCIILINLNGLYYVWAGGLNKFNKHLILSLIHAIIHYTLKIPLCYCTSPTDLHVVEIVFYLFILEVSFLVHQKLHYTQIQLYPNLNDADI